MILADFSKISLKLKQEDSKTKVWDPIRRKWIILTPEEHVRQYMLAYMIDTLCYPVALIAVEKAIQVGAMKKRFDIVVYNRDHQPWLLAECKAPEIEITAKTLHQLLGYQKTIRSSYWLLTNGHHTLCADATAINNIQWMVSLPVYQP